METQNKSSYSIVPSGETPPSVSIGTGGTVKYDRIKILIDGYIALCKKARIADYMIKTATSKYSGLQLVCKLSDLYDQAMERV